MNMKNLFDDFKMYVDGMDVQAVKKSIENAIEHTSNSYILDGQIVDNEINYTDSSTQRISPVHYSGKTYAFSSIDISYASMSFRVSEGRDLVA